MAIMIAVFGIAICLNIANERAPMNIYITYSLCVLILLQSCGGTKPSINRVDFHQSEGSKLKAKGISKEAAVSIANEDALRDYKSLTSFKVLPCEQSLFWRVIYDGGGPEYVIDKASGRIIKKQKLPQGYTENESGNQTNSPEKVISEQEAIRIARKDMHDTYGDRIDLSQFVDVACEQSKVWRVILDYRLRPGETIQDAPNGNFPKYVIDKKTGKILFKEIN
jgi:uncharacterized membrane protein YkoI